MVPVRSPAPYLEEALDAILGQDPPPAQVVVVDDGSPDPVALAPGQAARCELIRTEHGGPAHARAAGLGRLDAGLVALCDADDTWMPGSLAVRVSALAENPGAAVCFGHAVIVGPDGKRTGERWETLEPGEHSGTELVRRLFAHNPIPTSSAVIRRDVLAGEIDTGLVWAEDWDLWLRLAARGETFVYEPRAVVHYRRHQAALTGQVSELARAQLQLHARHSGLVDDATRDRTRALDLIALGHGLIRDGEYAPAREALDEAAGLARLSLRGRMLRWALGVPILRERLGRRDPYR